MTTTRNTRGATLVELLAVLLAIVVLLAAVLPALAAARGSAGVRTSLANMTVLGLANVLYAADWNGRQVTWVRDDLGAHKGSVPQYNDHAGCGYSYGPQCHPGMVAGRSCGGPTWGYWATGSNNIIFQPINFPGPPNACTVCTGWGNFRIPNLKSFHDYVNGRYHDPAFYAPNDTSVQEEVGECLNLPCEFNSECNPAWSSYCFSPAAMWHPDAMRSNADGGWQAPWELDHGYESPGLFQALYPDLKTHMIEHQWVQGPPAPCNPATPYCLPFYFNQGIDSAPVALFYDGHVRLLPNAEVYSSDQQVLTQTGGVDGLWHRGTPFGTDGYFINLGWDGTPLSHHILTTGGILGRDMLGEPTPLLAAPDAKAHRRRFGRPVIDGDDGRAPSAEHPRFTPEGSPP